MLIKIDRKSIKKNPNAGKTVREVPAHATTTIKIYSNHPDLHKILPDRITQLIRFVSRSCSSKSLNSLNSNEFKEKPCLPPSFEFIFLAAPDEDINAIINDLVVWGVQLKDISYETNINYEQIHCLNPEPEYFYKYIDKKVKCNNCGKTFSYTKLEDDYGYDGENEYLIDNICPKCHCSECCDKLEFEKFNKSMVKK